MKENIEVLYKEKKGKGVKSIMFPNIYLADTWMKKYDKVYNIITAREIKREEYYGEVTTGLVGRPQP